MNSTNKRKSVRYGCTVPVESKDGAAFDDSLTLDISKGGIGFVSRNEVPLNTQIAIELELTPEGDPVVVMGRVRWVHPTRDSEGFRVGMSFDKILSGTRSRLDRYLAKA